MLCCLGDLLLDVVVATTAAREHGADTPSATMVGAGGQAANVAAWAVALGGQARLLAKRADDLAGELIAEDLRRRGVEVAGPVTSGSTGVVVSMSEPGGERTMLTDRGVCPLLSASELREEWFHGCDRLHLPLYSLIDAPIREAAIEAARRVGRVSVDLSSVSVLQELGADQVDRLFGLVKPEVIFGNERESAVAAREGWNGGARIVVEKLGPAGVRVNGKLWQARPAEPADSTGAGDAFAAGFLLGGVDLGLEAAARAVSRLGAMPLWTRARGRHAMTQNEMLRVSAEVAEALAAGGPVVALETTLVSHGFPGMRGVEVALESERRVRAAGAVPATVAVVDGQIRAGLSPDVLERLAASPDARKAGPRDLAACVVSGDLGATTVGGTLAVCRLAGIRFMGTGGIGGAHRGFARTLDISADLAQLARTPALVVASGPKSLLDVPATAELLESLGVPVLGWRTGTLPRFYSAAGGPPVSARVDSAAEAARVAGLHWELTGGGLLVARPPTRSLDVDELTERALDAAERAGATGQAVTPAVLAYLHEHTGGATLEVNAELIADNAGLAAELAVAHPAASPMAT